MHAIRPSSIGHLLRRTRRPHAPLVTSPWRATSLTGSLPLPPLSRLGVTTQKRQLHDAFLLPPLYFTGLLLALWTWKCFMMVVFQNKIIYMPGLPPTARRERIEDYEKQCWGVRWEEKRGRWDGSGTMCGLGDIHWRREDHVAHGAPRRAVHLRPLLSGSAPSPAVLCGQLALSIKGSPRLRLGNASSIPPRLPDLSWVLRTLQRSKRPARYTMVCLSYRGYWRSRGRPSEKGINLDAQAALRWIGQMHEDNVGHRQQPLELVIWGQSIGSGGATNLAAWEGFPPTLRLRSLILETPFTSVRDMLGELYPQKWVPYRHLWPFLRNHLDSLTNIAGIAKNHRVSSGQDKPHVTIVEAGRDELVPADHGARLVRRCEEFGLPVEKKTVRGAFHNDAVIRLEGRQAVADAIDQVAAKI
uniref:Alpha beta superfamily n=1 Tax=Colletotrichum fructicola (strain Nara gc5) TaxID=1213859 RepID=L2G8G3_COLFN